MPYITMERRFALEDGYGTADTPGDLAYLLAKSCMDYYRLKPETFQTMNEIVGALESVKLDFAQNVLLPYEVRKRIENGVI